MSPAFPALAFCRDVGRSAQPGRERLTYFLDLEDFSTCTSWTLKHGEREGMTVVARDLRCWRVVSVTDLGVVRPFWERIFRFLLQQSVHRIDQQLTELEPTTLDQVKARAATAILKNTDDWRDDEAIAGEAEPPRDEQELLHEIIAKIHAATSVPQLINAIYDEALPG